MRAYIVSYDLNRETKRPNILADIKALGAWAKISESSYAVATTATADGIFNNLKKHVDGNDQLYIIPLRKPYAGFGPKSVNQWLDQNLPN